MSYEEINRAIDECNQLACQAQQDYQQQLHQVNEYELKINELSRTITALRKDAFIHADGVNEHYSTEELQNQVARYSKQIEECSYSRDIASSLSIEYYDQFIRLKILLNQFIRKRIEMISQQHVDDGSTLLQMEKDHQTKLKSTQ